MSSPRSVPQVIDCHKSHNFHQGFSYIWTTQTSQISIIIDEKMNDRSILWGIVREGCVIQFMLTIQVLLSELGLKIL